jgi:signal transduction histidine kinase
MPTDPNAAKQAAPQADAVDMEGSPESAAPALRRAGRRWKDNTLKLLELIRDTRPPPEQQALRLRTVERNIILPVKVLLVVLVAFYVFAPLANLDNGPTRLPRGEGSELVEPGPGNAQPGAGPGQPAHRGPRHRIDLSSAGTDPFGQGYQALRWMLGVYILINIPAALLLLRPKTLGLRLRHVQNLIFFVSSLDAIFVASLTYLTEGFASIVYWLFPGLIVRNSISLPLARPQLMLNLISVLLYVSAGVLDVSNNYVAPTTQDGGLSASLFYKSTSNSPAEPFLLRIALLLLLTFCCYGLQALLEKQRQTEQDARELITRQQQLDVAARLAAQIAHQIKNPLGIINTTIFNLERSLRAGKKEAAEHQLGMIREEVTRADQVITRLMGYAQLKEGRIEKLNVVEEIERVVHEVFPPVAKYAIRVERDFAPDLPGLWMQRQHLEDIFSNILLNAREALFGQGEIRISASRGPNGTVQVTFADNGPGIPPERVNQIFQPYFTTKEKGSGLGLAIVKQNMSLYGGTVRVESQPGQGARFILTFATRTLTPWTP